MKKITKSVINLSEIPEELHKYAELTKYKLYSYVEFHIDNSESDKLIDWLLSKYPTLNRKISFLIYIDCKNKEIVVPKGYYDQDLKDFEQAFLNDFKNKVKENITILEQYPDNMKLEDLDFKTQYVWDTDLQRLGLSSRLFTNGSEFGDTIYRLQKPNDKIRWCVFSVDRNYYISKEEDEPNNGWCEVWTKQMNNDLEEAKKYCEEDAFRSFIDVEIHFCNKCKYHDWVGYEVVKPPIGVEVIAQSDAWISEDYNKKGIRVGFQNEDDKGPFVSARWNNSSDTYEDCEEFKPTRWKFLL